MQARKRVIFESGIVPFFRARGWDTCGALAIPAEGTGRLHSYSRSLYRLTERGLRTRDPPLFSHNHQITKLTSLYLSVLEESKGKTEKKLRGSTMCEQLTYPLLSCVWNCENQGSQLEHPYCLGRLTYINIIKILQMQHSILCYTKLDTPIGHS